MRTKLLLLFLIINGLLSAQSWQPFHTESNVNFATTVVDGSDLILAYTDDVNDNPFVRKFDGSTWTDFNSGNAISQESISRTMVLATGSPSQDKIHLGYIDDAITKVEWYESDSGGNFNFINTAAPGASTSTITYADRGLKLFIELTGTLPNGFIYNARIGTKITNFNLMGGRELSGNNGSAGTFQFPRLDTQFGGVTATEFDYSSYNETFVVERYSNGFNQFGKITLSPSGTVRQFYGREETNVNDYIRIDGIDGESTFAAYDSTNDVARVSLTPNGAATTTSGIFQHNVNATFNGVFKFEKYGDDYYLLYTDTNNKLQIDKYTNSTNTWSTLVDPNIVTSSSDVYDMFFYDNRLFIMHTDTSNTLNILELTNTPSTNVIFVDKDATGNNDGTSWVDAFTDITFALQNAQNDDEFWIKGGTYIPTATGSGNNSTGITITATGLKIYGGFAGTETQLSERVFGSNETIISGDVNGNDSNGTPDFITSSSTNDNIGTLLRINDYSDNQKTVIDGLTFTRSYNQNGFGAVLLESASSDVFPNVFFNNCKFSYNLHSIGGAMRLQYFNGINNQNAPGIGLDVDQCTFEFNVARVGAGIQVANLDNFNASFVNASVNISNSLFHNNIAKDGASGNQGQYASALTVLQSDPESFLTTNIINCTFAKNQELGTVFAENGRFVIALEALPNANVHDATLSNNIFWDNEVTSGAAANSVGSNILANVFIGNSIGEDNFVNIAMGQQSNNSNNNPLFTDSSNDDFTLQSSSPAVDSGNNTAVVGNADLLNNQRIFNTTVDMGAFEFDASALSVDDFSQTQNDIKLYPNPVVHTLNIETIHSIQRIELYSVTGQRIKLLKGTNIINVSNLNAGIYFAKIFTDRGSITKRFIKE